MISRREAIRRMAAASIGFLTLRWHTYRKPVIDLPVSLVVGTVRTPEFACKRQAYIIMIQTERRLPFGEMLCMMGLSSGPLSRYNCDKEPLLQADWTLWADGIIVGRGSVHHIDERFDSAEDYIFRHLGVFQGEEGKKYVLEVEFTSDASPLNVTNPHLIVMMTRATD